MKKIIACLLAICVIASLAACGSSNNTSDPTKAADNSGNNAQTETAAPADNSGSGEETQAADSEGPRKLVVGSTSKVTASFCGENESNAFGFALGMDPLVYLTPDGEVKSDILESWESTDEGVSMTIKDGITFTNGEPFEASDIVWMYQHQLENGGSRGDVKITDFFDLANAKVLEDGKTAFIPSFEPCAPGIKMFKDYVRDASFFAEHPETDTIWWNTCQGTGPYEVVEQVDGSHLTMKLRDNYWGDKSQFVFDEIQFNYYGDQNAMAIELQSGAIDVALDVNSFYYGEFEGNDEYITKKHGEGNLTSLALDATQIEAINDEKVREAIGLALNADEAGLIGADGMCESALSPLPKNCFGYEEVGGYLNGSEADIAKAKDLLKEAGYENGFDIALQVRDRDGALGEYLQAALTKIGLNCTLEEMEFQNYRAAMSDGLITATIGEIQTDNSGEPLNAYVYFTTSQSTMCGTIPDDDFNALCAKATATVNEAEREKLVKQIQEEAYDFSYRYWLYEKQKGWVYRAGVLPDDFEAYYGNVPMGFRFCK